MKKRCHNIAIRVFTRTEPDELLHAAFETLTGLELEKEKLCVDRTDATGADETSMIIILELNLKKQRHIRRCLENISENLNQEQKEMLKRQQNRLDENGNFYLRLDKPRLLEGIWHITDSGNCFHMRICIAAYPKTEENCRAQLNEIFSNGNI